MMFRYAIRNLVRKPLKTILYFGIAFLLTVAITASLLIFGATDHAAKALDENYIFVASLLPQHKDSLRIPSVNACLQSDMVQGYNVVMAECKADVPGGITMRNMPTEGQKENPSAVFTEPAGCPLKTVENLFLLPYFYAGECTFREGGGFTKDGYMGSKTELVLPSWFADLHGIHVGDTIMTRFKDIFFTEFFKSEVVGIYDVKKTDYQYTDYPAYIPFSKGENMYGVVKDNRLYEQDEYIVERADFILPSRDSFKPFYKEVKENGVDFSKATLIFNNNAYDAMRSDLNNIHMIALLVFLTVAFVGGSVLVFFTVYIVNAGKGERTLLRALGMPKKKRNGILLTELMTVLLLAIGIGIGAGYGVGHVICDGVNTSVSEAQMDSATLQNTESQYSALERPVKMTFSLHHAEVEKPDIPLYYKLRVGEDEIGISSHMHYRMKDPKDENSKEEIPLHLVGITDLSAIETSISREELEKQPYYFEKGLFVYVSKDSTLYQEGKMVQLKLLEYRIGENCTVHAKGIHPNNYVVRVYVIGTYEDNPYCSGEDVLISMKDYQYIMNRKSFVTDPYYFQRIGSVIKKEEP